MTEANDDQPRNQSALRYSVVVPVFNEADNIGNLFLAVKPHLPANYEFLIVYDFDEDTTIPAISRIAENDRPENLRLIRNRLGRGVRYAIEAGMRSANSPVVVVMMADLSDDLPKLAEMVQRVEAGADVVAASRYMPGGKQIGGPWLKGKLSRIAGVSLHHLIGLPTHDPTNSFKAYKTSFLRQTKIESPAGFVLGMELTLKAYFTSGRVEEVPAYWYDRTAGESRFKLMAWLPHYLRWYVWALRQRM